MVLSQLESATKNPDRDRGRGFPFLRSDSLTYQSLRFASAMMMIESNRRVFKKRGIKCAADKQSRKTFELAFVCR